MRLIFKQILTTCMGVVLQQLWKDQEAIGVDGWCFKILLGLRLAQFVDSLGQFESFYAELLCGVACAMTTTLAASFWPYLEQVLPLWSNFAANYILITSRNQAAAKFVNMFGGMLFKAVLLAGLWWWRPSKQRTAKSTQYQEVIFLEAEPSGRFYLPPTPITPRGRRV